ncbi:hypothetical protein [Streptomyces liangshanensis]|uniref:hypothetical protein n=1 Tax=Streptomyces liangshanensis TaxID=2717324 RepID=UPI003133305B
MPAPSTVTQSLRVSAGAPAGTAGPDRADPSAGTRDRTVRPPRSRAAARPPAEPADDLLRWAAFSCLLVPVVLGVYGTSFGGTASAAFGLAAVTAACRLLLRRSERTAARLRAEEARAAGVRDGEAATVRGGEARTVREAVAAHAPGMYGTAGNRRAYGRSCGRARGRQGAHRGSRGREGSAPGD